MNTKIYRVIILVGTTKFFERYFNNVFVRKILQEKVSKIENIFMRNIQNTFKMISHRKILHRKPQIVQKCITRKRKDFLKIQGRIIKQN